MKLLWTRRARSDLTDIVDYIARDSVDAALRMYDKLEECAERILESPHAKRIVPEFDDDDIREAIIGNYRMVYRIESKTIVILTVFEGHRLMPIVETDDVDES